MLPPTTDDWKEKAVCDIAAPGNHSTSTGPFGSAIGSRFFRKSGVPVIRGGNLSSDSGVRLKDDDLVFLSHGKASEFTRSIVRSGDLVFTCWGTINQVGLIDKTAGYPAYVISNKQMKLTPDPNLAIAEFLYYLFSGPQMQHEIVEGAIGSSIPGFNLTRLRSMRIRLPGLNEQRHIAKALRDIHDLSALLERLIAKKRAVKQGMMQELLTGNTRLPGFTEPWRRGRFEDLAAPVRERTTPAAVAQETLLVELDQIDSGSGTLLARSAASSAISLKTIFREGDVLFGKLRAYLRKFWLADSDGICTTEIWAFRAKPGAIGAYVRYVVETDRFIEAASEAYGTHMPRSDWGILRNFGIEVPPREEQAAIAAALLDSDREIDTLRALMSKAKAVKHGMMQELLTGGTRLPIQEAIV